MEYRYQWYRGIFDIGIQHVTDLWAYIVLQHATVVKLQGPKNQSPMNDDANERWHCRTEQKMHYSLRPLSAR